MKRGAHKYNTFTVIALLVFGVGIALPAYAKKTLEDAGPALQTLTQKTGIDEGDVTTIVGRGIEAAFQLVGLIFFILMVYAGFKWMVARGNEENVTKARNTLVAAVIGLMVTVSAYAITSFITNRVLEGQSGTAPTLNPDVLGGGEGAVQLGCCISYTKSDIYQPTKATWKIMSEGQCKLMNESLDFDPKNENKFAVKACPGPKAGCWLFYPGQTAAQCEATYDNL